MSLRAEEEPEEQSGGVPDELKNVVTQHVMTHMVGTYFKPAKYGNEVVEICVKNGRMGSRETKRRAGPSRCLSRAAIIQRANNFGFLCRYSEC